MPWEGLPNKPESEEIEEKGVELVDIKGERESWEEGSQAKTLPWGRENVLPGWGGAA